jgi:hypothetical protein
LVLAVIGLVFINYQFAKNNPGGNDFLAHYVGTRELIFSGVSPYSDQVAEKIQTAVFGRLAQEGEIEHRVVYPLYSTLFFAPFALIKEYLIARVAWMTFLELSLIATAYITLRLLSWQPPLGVLAFYYLFSVLWYHGFRGVINGNAVVLVGFFLAGTLLALKQGNDKAAGLLMAFSTIKPNLALLFVIFTLIWCIYQKRTQVILWFFGVLIILAVGGMLIIPDWIYQNLWELLKYPDYNPAGTLGEVIGLWFPDLQTPITWTIGIGLGSLLIYEWWQGRKAEFEGYLWTVCLTLVISQWIGIRTDPGNFVILFTPFVMVLAFWDKRWGKSGTVIVTLVLGVVLLGLWILFATTVNFDYQPMQNSVMFFPLPALVILGLYWIKWWVIGPKKLLWDDLK